MSCVAPTLALSMSRPASGLLCGAATGIGGAVRGPPLPVGFVLHTSCNSISARQRLLLRPGCCCCRGARRRGSSIAMLQTRLRKATCCASPVKSQGLIRSSHLSLVQASFPTTAVCQLVLAQRILAAYLACRCRQCQLLRLSGHGSKSCFAQLRGNSTAAGSAKCSRCSRVCRCSCTTASLQMRLLMRLVALIEGARCI